ncbi:MAG: hypothetical protein ABIG94_10545 [Pseudomonadota bacterium]
MKESIVGYSFPAIYYDFINNCQVNPTNMGVVEEYVFKLLRSKNIIDVKYGLANVLYWGYAQVGYRDTRVQRFLNNTTDNQIKSFQELLLDGAVPDIATIKNLRLPEFSGMSFVSKIVMFLDPVNYCVLDDKVSNLRNPNCRKALSHLVFGPNEMRIRISRQNQNVYNAWREECRAISAQYYQNVYRVVDVERGFFTLIQTGEIATAQEIYNDA